MVKWCDNPEIQMLVHLLIKQAPTVGTPEPVWEDVPLNDRVSSLASPPSGQVARTAEPVTSSPRSTATAPATTAEVPKASKPPMFSLPVERSARPAPAAPAAPAPTSRPQTSSKAAQSGPTSKGTKAVQRRKRAKESQPPRFSLPVERSRRSQPAPSAAAPATPRPPASLPTAKPSQPLKPAKAPKFSLPVERSQPAPVPTPPEVSVSADHATTKPATPEPPAPSTTPEPPAPAKTRKLSTGRTEMAIKPPRFPVSGIRKPLILVDLVAREAQVEIKRPRVVPCTLEDYCHLLLELRLRRGGGTRPLAELLTAEEQQLLPQVGFQPHELEQRASEPVAIIQINGKEKPVFAMIDMLDEVLKEGYQKLAKLQQQLVYTAEDRQEVIAALMPEDRASLKLREDLLEELRLMVYTCQMEIAEAEDVLLEKIFDPAPSIHLRALELLGYIGSARVKPPLEEFRNCLQDTARNQDIREYVDMALERISKATMSE